MESEVFLFILLLSPRWRNRGPGREKKAGGLVPLERAKQECVASAGADRGGKGGCGSLGSKLRKVWWPSPAAARLVPGHEDPTMLSKPGRPGRGGSHLNVASLLPFAMGAEMGKWAPQGKGWPQWGTTGVAVRFPWPHPDQGQLIQPQGLNSPSTRPHPRRSPYQHWILTATPGGWCH